MSKKKFDAGQILDIYERLRFVLAKGRRQEKHAER